MEQVILKNGEEIILREGKKEDSSKIIVYMNKIAGETDYHAFGKGEFQDTVENEENFLEDCLQSDNKLFIIAEKNNQIIGNLTFIGGHRSRIRHAGNIGITVLKDFWGLGIGRILMNYLIDWAKESKIVKKINLTVREDNTRAIKLYEDLGFKKEGLITRYFYVNEKYYNAIFMGLNID